MHEREYKRIRATIEAEYKKKLEALELIYSMAAPSKNGAQNSVNPSVRGDLALGVVAAIRTFSGNFNVRDVETTLKMVRPTMEVKRASLSNTLKRLEGKEIEIVERGSGKKPSTYRRLIGVG